MPKIYPSPLTEADLEQLAAMAHKGNAIAGDPDVAPMYVAGDGGAPGFPDAWLFVCWPAQHPLARRAGQRVFGAIAQVAAEEFGARMDATAPNNGEAP